MAAALDRILGDSELVVQPVQIRLPENHPDGAGQRRRVGHDRVAGHRHEVAARSRRIRHRDHHRLLLAEQVHLAPDLVAGGDFAARRIDAHHHALDHGVVLHQLQQVVEAVRGQRGHRPRHRPPDCRARYRPAPPRARSGSSRPAAAPWLYVASDTFFGSPLFRRSLISPHIWSSNTQLIHQPRLQRLRRRERALVDDGAHLLGAVFLRPAAMPSTRSPYRASTSWSSLRASPDSCRCA